MNNNNTITLRDVTSYTGRFGTRARYMWAHVPNTHMPKSFQYRDNMFLGVGEFDVFVTPPPVPGKRKHRMKTNLPCGRVISAGRLLQHGNACKVCQDFMLRNG